jgi:hypothetical protein
MMMAIFGLAFAALTVLNALLVLTAFTAVLTL